MLFFVLAYQNHIYTSTTCSWDVIDAGSVKLETPYCIFQIFIWFRQTITNLLSGLVASVRPFVGVFVPALLAAELNTAQDQMILEGGPLAAEQNTAHDLIIERQSIGSGAKHSSWLGDFGPFVGLFVRVLLAAELNTTRDQMNLEGGPLAAELNTAHDLIIGRWSTGSGAKHSSRPDNWKVVYWHRGSLLAPAHDLVIFEGALNAHNARLIFMYNYNGVTYQVYI